MALPSAMKLERVSYTGYITLQEHCLPIDFNVKYAFKLPEVILTSLLELDVKKLNMQVQVKKTRHCRFDKTELIRSIKKQISISNNDQPLMSIP